MRIDLHTISRENGFHFTLREREYFWGRKKRLPEKAKKWPHPLLPTLLRSTYKIHFLSDRTTADDVVNDVTPDE
jgi:hypothetical protein